MRLRTIEAYQVDIEELIVGVPHTSLLQIAVKCAERIITAWGTFAPNDHSVGTALNDICKMMEGVTSRTEILKWKTILKQCVIHASNAYEETDKLHNVSEASPAGVAAFKADYSASAVASLAMLATVDEQTEDVEWPTGVVS